MKNKLPVIEIFGPTIQGEGTSAGQKTMFLRTAGCDYRCSWCDSAFTWDGSEKPQMMTAAQIWNEMCMLAKGHEGFSYITISGGNPALIGQPMYEFIEIAQSHSIRIGLETQGSKSQDWMDQIDDIVISPKPPSSGMNTNIDVLAEIINFIQKSKRFQIKEATLTLKIVIFDLADFEFAKQIHITFPKIPMYLSVGNENVSSSDMVSLRNDLLNRLDWLFTLICNEPQMNAVRALPQFHTLVWGNKRGV